jgi:RNA polymerase sigma factor (sigma-70 family)
MDAEDLTTLVFIQAMENLGKYRHEGRFLAWLMVIARRRATDFFRRRRPLVSLEFVETLLVESGRAAIEAERADHLRALAKWIEQLTEEEKELLRLRFAADLTFHEIADVLECTEDSVKKTILSPVGAHQARFGRRNQMTSELERELKQLYELPEPHEAFMADLQMKLTGQNRRPESIWYMAASSPGVCFAVFNWSFWVLCWSLGRKRYGQWRSICLAAEPGLIRRLDLHPRTRVWSWPSR